MMVTHKLRIVSMEWANLRNYEQVPNKNIGERKLELNDKNHNLLQIQNNYGKTTSMHLLRSIFTGLKIEKEHLNGYRYRKGNVGWGGDPNLPAKFKVYMELDDEFFSIETVIDGPRETQQFFTYRQMNSHNDAGGKRDGWQPPEYFKHLFEGKGDFVDLFILNGEKARELNRAASGGKVSNAIKQVTGLSNICDLIDEGNKKGQITVIVEDILAEDLGRGLGKADGLDIKLRKCHEHMKWLEGKRDTALKTVEKIQKAIDDNDKDLENYDKEKMENDEVLAQAVEGHKDAKSELEKLTGVVMKELFNPSNVFEDSLWPEVKKFYNSQIQGKMPKGITKNWFNEIVANWDTCICGTTWDDEMVKWIEDHKDDYLDDLLMPRVKSMQADIVLEKSTSNIGQLKARLDAQRKALSQAGKHERDMRKQFPPEERAIYDRLKEDEFNLTESMKNAKFEFEIYNSRNRDFIKDNDLDRYTMTKASAFTIPVVQPNIFEEIQNISELEKVEAHISSEILKTSQSATKARGAKILQNVLFKATQRLLNEIHEELEVKINQVARKMPGVDVEIEISEESMIFKNLTGDIQDNLNESAELGAIYGLVASLNQYSDISLPIVVDTPLAGFGKGMAKAWKEVVPGNFDQTIALINSGEKDLLKFWWSNEQNKDQVSVFTMLRENEDVRTGIDLGWDPEVDPQDLKTTGPMYISSSTEDFELYEIDVGYEWDKNRGGDSDE